MKKVYPAVLTPDNGWVLAYIPDFDIMTQGENLADAIDMARDAVCLMGVQYEDENKKLPEPSEIFSVPLEKGQISTLIDCDFEKYRIMLDNRTIRKNCTLPAWLSQKAEAAHINFSQTLQEALKEKLNIQ